MYSRITICCVDTTERIRWSVRALEASAARVNFSDVVLLTDAVHARSCDIPAPIRVVEIEPLRSIEAYSNFILNSLSNYFETSHILIVQWDGYIINKKSWCDEFLEYDYIGAVWPHESESFNVGNGGFSLRSRKLIDAWQELHLPGGHPEDLYIGKVYRKKLEQKGVKFAPMAMASRFSIEEGSLQTKPFGFHGPFHFPEVLSSDLMSEFLRELTVRSVSAWYLGSLLRELARCCREERLDESVCQDARDMLGRMVIGLGNSQGLSPVATSFCKSLIRYGYLRTAVSLLAMQRDIGSDRWLDGRLWLRCRAQQLAGRGLDRQLDVPVKA